MQSEIDRRRFVQLLAGGGATFLGLSGAARLRAAQKPQGSLVQWARLKFQLDGPDQDDWGVHPQGDLNLIDNLRDHTTVNLHNHWNVADVADIRQMSAFPLLFMHAEERPALDDLARKNLREYLLRGGFLYAEDCVIGRMNHGVNVRNDFFFMRMVDELPKIMPEAKLERLPNDHPIFHCFYDLNDGLPHMQGTPHGAYGLTLNGRLLALLSPSDMHCGWTNGDAWFGPGKTEQAMKMGANIYVYAMTQSPG
jgi:hypothetical protein